MFADGYSCVDSMKSAFRSKLKSLWDTNKNIPEIFILLVGEELSGLRGLEPQWDLDLSFGMEA